MSNIQTLITDHIDIWTAADTGPKSGRGRSSANAASVYGIRKLRELILELAVRGKLVPQDANDEPASELLKRIQLEKNKLIAEGKIKKERNPVAPHFEKGGLGGISEDEKPFGLPHGWEWVRIGRIGHDWGQKTPDSDFTYIEVSAIDSQRGAVSSPELVTPENAPSRARKVVKQGTVIYSTIRPYLLNIAVIEEDFLPEPIASTAFAIVHPFCSMPPRYFLCFFRSPVFVRYVESVQMGIAYPAINDGQFFSGLISLPPIEEQHRIVAKVDELMALCDQLETQHNNAAEAHEKLVSHLLGTLTQSQSAEDFSANWQRIAAHFDILFTTEASIDALKQTLLQLAVMGKLTVKTDNWNVASLNDVCESIVDCPHSTPKFQLSGMVCIDTTCFKQGVLQRDRLRYVSEGSFHERNKRLYPRSGDIVFAREGSIGESVIIPDGIDACLGQRVMLLRPSHTMLSRYLRMAISSPGFLEKILHHHKGVGAKHINVKDVRSATIPLPPLDEQHRIVAKVDELMALSDQLKTRITSANQLQQKLADVLVEQVVV